MKWIFNILLVFVFTCLVGEFVMENCLKEVDEIKIELSDVDENEGEQEERDAEKEMALEFYNFYIKELESFFNHSKKMCYLALKSDYHPIREIVPPQFVC